MASKKLSSKRQYLKTKGAAAVQIVKGGITRSAIVVNNRCKQKETPSRPAVTEEEYFQSSSKCTVTQSLSYSADGPAHTSSPVAVSPPPESFRFQPRRNDDDDDDDDPSDRLASTFDERYQLLQSDDALVVPLGHGISGRVLPCIHRRTSKPCAVKIIRKSRIVRKDRIRREISLLRQIHHPNIIRLHDVYDDDTEVRIVTELCRGGELFDRIIDKAMKSKEITRTRNEGGSGSGDDDDDGDDRRRWAGAVPACFREEDAARIVRQVLSAVSYLHSNGIVHRDIKPENILFEEAEDGGGDKSRVKLIDFGLSIRHGSSSSSSTGAGSDGGPDEKPLSSAVGTPYYMAPELLAGRYDKSCDLWSVGVLTYVMLSGKPPFNGATDQAIFAKIKAGRYRMDGNDESVASWAGGASEEAKDFIRRLLDVDPRRRWTADMALGHVWLESATAADNDDGNDDEPLRGELCYGGCFGSMSDDADL